MNLSRPNRFGESLLLLGALASLAGCRGEFPGNEAGTGGGDRPPGDLCITEIMYHPVMEESLEDVHEFVEIYNRGEDAISLSGMKLRGGADFDFGDYTLEPGAYVVVAKNRAALLSVSHYTIDPAVVVGDYEGTLSNNGESVRIEAENGETVDSVDYEDGFPWPIAADGLGGGEDWLAPEYLPLSSHQYAGRSLERLNCDSAGNDPGTWVASELDGATPGGPSPQAGPNQVVVTSLRAQSSSGGMVAPGQQAQVTIGLSQSDGVTGLRLESFIDELGSDNEPTQSTPLSGSGTSLSATLEAAPENSIVRYRVWGDRGAGEEIISPRETDPYEWHAYFVEPDLQTTSKTYHLFIDPDDWTQMWDNVSEGREDGCDVNPTWQDRVGATFVYEGEVFDVQVRYQGSRWNRTGGPEAGGFDGMEPDRPSPLRGLSYRVGFPRYHRLADRGVRILNKLTQGCPGYTATVGFQLFRDAGLMASSAEFVRLQINGGYYRYMAELERIDEDLLSAHHEATDGADVGHLFKASGSGWDEDAGPYGPGDGRLLEENCGFSPLERYEYTYPRKSHDWAGHENLISMLEGLHEARDTSQEAVRAFLEQHWDVQWMITYYGVMNYMSPFDDSFHNYYYYQRLSDQKWILIPWDLDLTFGGLQDANASLFVGIEGEQDAHGGWWNVIKDSFLRSYPEEFVTRIKELNRTLLSPGRIKPMIQAAHNQANWPEAEDAPGGVDCNPQEALSNMNDFVDDRNEFIQQWTGGPN